MTCLESLLFKNNSLYRIQVSVLNLGYILLNDFTFLYLLQVEDLYTFGYSPMSSLTV